jgi:hypothetical protein
MLQGKVSKIYVFRLQNDKPYYVFPTSDPDDIILIYPPGYMAEIWSGENCQESRSAPTQLKQKAIHLNQLEKFGLSLTSLPTILGVMVVPLRWQRRYSSVHALLSDRLCDDHTAKSFD